MTDKTRDQLWADTYTAEKAAGRFASNPAHEADMAVKAYDARLHAQVAALTAAPADTATASGAATIAATICKSVAELPDRNSPADWPDAMLVTHDELSQIVTAALASAPAQPVAEPAQVSAVESNTAGAVPAHHTDNAPLGYTIHEKSAWSVGYEEGYRASRGQAPAAGAVAGPGWQMVPVEPTEAMFTRFSQQIETGVVYVGGFLQAYRCMLDAAPTLAAPAPSVLEDAALYDALISAAGTALEVLQKHRQIKVDWPVGELGRRAHDELNAAIDAASKQGANHD